MNNNNNQDSQSHLAKLAEALLFHRSDRGSNSSILTRRAWDVGFQYLCSSYISSQPWTSSPNGVLALALGIRPPEGWGHPGIPPKKKSKAHMIVIFATGV